MARIAADVTELIGHTPLSKLNRGSGRSSCYGGRQAREPESSRQREGPHRVRDDRKMLRRPGRSRQENDAD